MKKGVPFGRTLRGMARTRIKVMAPRKHGYPRHMREAV